VAVEGRIAKDQVTKTGLPFPDLKCHLAAPNAGVTLERHRSEVTARLVSAYRELPGQPLLAGLLRPFQFDPVRHGTVGAGRAVPSLRAVVRIAGRGTQHLERALNFAPMQWVPGRRRPGCVVRYGRRFMVKVLLTQLCR
jgi:hypothetical protein